MLLQTTIVVLSSIQLLFSYIHDVIFFILQTGALGTSDLNYQDVFT